MLEIKIVYAVVGYVGGLITVLAVYCLKKLLCC